MSFKEYLCSKAVELRKLEEEVADIFNDIEKEANHVYVEQGIVAFKETSMDWKNPKMYGVAALRFDPLNVELDPYYLFLSRSGGEHEGWVPSSYLD